MMKKLYEFSALAHCTVVVAAADELAARKEIETYHDAWFKTGSVGEITDVDLVDVRDPKGNDLSDEAHVVVDGD